MILPSHARAHGGEYGIVTPASVQLRYAYSYENPVQLQVVPSSHSSMCDNSHINPRTGILLRK